MKNFFRFLLMSLFLATSFSVASCSDDDDDNADSIIGTWLVIEEEDTSITVQFNSNRTGSVALKSEMADMTERFEYVYRPEEHYLVITGSMLKGGYDVSLTKSKLILTNRSVYGDDWEFTRR